MRAEPGDVKKLTLSDIAEFVGGIPQGNRSKSICCIAELKNATPESIAHCTSPAQTKYLQSTEAGIVILSKQNCEQYKGNSIVVDNPRLAFAHVVNFLYGQPKPRKPGIHTNAFIESSVSLGNGIEIAASAVIGANVSIGDDVYIGPNVVIGDNVRVSSSSSFDANVTIYSNTVIGDEVRISAATSIGAPGFSYEWDGERWVEILNIGNTIIGNQVSIGACSSIDRGSIQDTEIADGVKIDNNVQIGHNTKIGKHTIIAGNTGIAGSVIIGRRCRLGGQVGVVDNVSIADDVRITAGSLVTKSIFEPGEYSSSLPAKKAQVWRRMLARFNKDFA